jgi:signal peptidase I
MSYVVLALLVVAGAVVVLNARTGTFQVYDVYPTPSMRPTLEVGDLVVVQTTSYANIHVGDVIVFARPNPVGGGCGSEIIVHRVVNITSDGLITQGDNRATNPYPDEGPPVYEWPPVPVGCVRGVVLVSIPYLGDISQAFPPPLNYVLVAAIIVLIFLAEFFGGRREESDESTGADGIASDPAGRALGFYRL